MELNWRTGCAVLALAASGFLVSCADPNLRVPVSEYAASESFCAYSIEFQSRGDADRFVAGSSRRVVEPALRGRLFLLREEARVTWVSTDPPGPCSDATAPQQVERVHAVSVLAQRISADELAERLAAQRDFHLDELGARQCIVRARPTPAGDDARDMFLLGSFGDGAFPSMGLFQTQTESSGGITYFATGSSCETLDAVVGSVNAQIPWYQRKIELEQCDGTTLAQCGFPDQIGRGASASG